ncbi:MAG: NAD(P)H-hydrate dehydratase [Paludibacter sp.]|nr:NAD(P)H-hydrate dehydratase [Paludibacter sp.]
MKIFTTSQIRQLDQYTIDHEPIASIDLMERAADALFEAIKKLYPLTNTVFCVMAGPGNNGGDALALARKLFEAGYPVNVYLYRVNKLSSDCEINKLRLLETYPGIFTEYTDRFVSPEIVGYTVIVDGLFGSGLNRPLSGIFAEAVEFINKANKIVIAIDVPSGLYGDGCHLLTEPTVKAKYTFTFQFPKIAFFFAENDSFIGQWSALDIHLHPEGIKTVPSGYSYLDVDDIRQIYKKRQKFSHKGSFGHLALLAGSKGMAGASILAAKAALRSGVGLLTLHGPEGNRCILQTISPEVIYEADHHPDCISEFYHADKYDALAIGPGIGIRTATVDMLRELFRHLKEPCVLDADALNIIASEKKMLNSVPAGSILTPHPKEFERLTGERGNSYLQMKKALEISAQYKIYIVLKGAYSKIITPEGNVLFNSTGNPGMATAGSGDVLTGILGALLAQGYSPENAVKLGVFLHGLAADLALKNESEESLMAGDIVAGLGKAFRYITGQL